MSPSRFLTLAALGLALAPAAEAADPTALAARWDALLKKHVRASGGVDYRGLAADEAELDGLLKAHAGLDMKGRSDAARKATYINLYNAGMVWNLLRHVKAAAIDLGSPKFLALEINGIRVPGGNIWNGSYKLPLGGAEVTLDEVEHGLIRGKAKVPAAVDAWKVSTLDPRIHAAVNCAAVSCPRVRELAYTEENVDRLLDENMREYVSSEAQFAKESDDKLKANQIVLWYYDDFDDHGQKVKLGGAGGYLATFLTEGAKDRDWKAKHLKESFNDRSATALRFSSAFRFHYDWRVNDVRNVK